MNIDLLEATNDLASSQQSDKLSIDDMIVGRKPDSWFQNIDKQLSSEMPELGSSDITLVIVNGKLVTNEKQSDIYVGSAGGWNWEVQKYGIGRYEGNLLKQKKCLMKKSMIKPNEEINLSRVCYE